MLGCSGAQPNACVCAAGCYRRRHSGVRKFLRSVAVDLGCINPLVSEHLINEEARPGAALSIDELKPFRGDVTQIFHVRRVAMREHQSLFALCKAYQPIATPPQRLEK